VAEIAEARHKLKMRQKEKTKVTRAVTMKSLGSKFGSTSTISLFQMKDDDPMCRSKIVISMLRFDAAQVLASTEEIKGFYHRGHRGSQGKLDDL
jgi:hypothetical protein